MFSSSSLKRSMPQHTCSDPDAMGGGVGCSRHRPHPPSKNIFFKGLGPKHQESFNVIVALLGSLS